MALDVAVRSFDWLTTQAAATTIDVNFGFTPKVLIAFSCHKLSTDGVTTSPTRGAARFSFAAKKAAGGGVNMSANRRTVCFESVDGNATGDYRARQRNDAFATVGGSTGTLDIDAEANWPASSVRFIVDVQNAAVNEHITVVALGGTDISDATVGTITEPASTGNQSTSGLGFQPNLVLFASIGNATENSANVTPGGVMFGAGDGSRSWVCFGGGDNTAVTMNTVGYSKSSQIIAIAPQPNASTLDAEATLTSLDSDGFSLNWSSQTAGGRKLFYIAIKMATSAVRVDNLLSQTNTSNFSVTGYGQQPVLALFSSACRAESTASTPSDNLEFSVGAATSSTARECQAVIDRDAQANSDEATDLETDQTYANISTGLVIEGLMDLVSFDSDGMTLVMDDADPSQNFVGVITFGTPASGGSPQSITAGDQVITITAPSATVSSGAVSIAGGNQTVTITAPTAAISTSGSPQSISAGNQTVTITAPAAILSAFINLLAGNQTVTVTAPVASISAGAISIPAGNQLVTITAPFASISNGAGAVSDFWCGNTGMSAMTGGGDIEELD